MYVTERLSKSFNIDHINTQKKQSSLSFMHILSNPDSVNNFLKQHNNTEIIRYYNELIENSPNLEEIPRFYAADSKQFLSSKEICSFANIMINLANNESFESIANRYPTFQDIQNLRDAYKELGMPFHNRVIKYVQYKKLRQAWPERLRHILTSRLFLEIGGQSIHTISIDELFKHLDMIPICVNHFILLNKYDILKTGSIDYDSFASYVAEIAQVSSLVQKVAYQDFQQKFVEYVSAVIFTVLDPMKTNKILIHDLFQDKYYQSFVMLESSGNDISRNYFSPEVTMKYIEEFEDMDSNDDGLLSPQDLFSLQGTKFTKAFVARVFDVIGCDGNTDFGWYIRFRFMWDNVGMPWSNQIMFDILDVDGNGEITYFELNYFYREIQKILMRDSRNNILQIPTLESWMDEQFDRYGIPNSTITKEMFIKTDMIFLVRPLIDFFQFYTIEYEVNEVSTFKGFKF